MRVRLFLVLICTPLIFFCWLIALARTSNTILNRYGENGQHYLVPDFSRIVLSFFTLSMMLPVGLFYIAFIMFRYVPCISALSKIFIMKGCCVLSKDLHHLMRWSCGVFFSVSLYGELHWEIFIDSFLFLWNEAYLVMVDDFL